MRSRYTWGKPPGAFSLIPDRARQVFAEANAVFLLPLHHLSLDDPLGPKLVVDADVGHLHQVPGL
jgi:hypothetical protein